MVRLAVVEPLDALHAFRNVLRVQHVKAFGMSLELGEVVEVCLTLLVPDPLEENDAATTITNRENVTGFVEADCRQQVMLTDR